MMPRTYGNAGLQTFRIERFRAQAHDLELSLDFKAKGRGLRAQSPQKRGIAQVALWESFYPVQSMAVGFYKE